VVKGSFFVAWSSDKYIDVGSQLQLGGFEVIGYIEISSDHPSTIANLTDKRTEDGLEVLESELRIVTMANISNSSISCLHANGSSATINLQLLGKCAYWKF
jgi:hypothetical protein